MNAFVQVHNDGEFLNENMFTAWRAFNWYGYEVTKFKFEQLEDLPITKETPCFGGVETMRRIFNKLKINHKVLESIPEQLKQFLGRKVEVTTIADAVKRGRVFIKPTDNYRKAFDGHINEPGRMEISFASKLHNHPDMTVYVSEIVEFDVEYRVCIHEKKILDARPYQGDASLGFDKAKVQQMMDALDDAPIAYCLDVGLMKGQTVLVEATDAWSFGHYGLSMVDYGKMLIARWGEITGVNISGVEI